MMDDVWAIDCVQVAQDRRGQDIVEAVGDEWAKKGLEENCKKRVTYQAGEEVQGLFVHPEDTWIGVSVAKRFQLWGIISSAVGDTVSILEISRKDCRQAGLLHGSACVHTLCLRSFLSNHSDRSGAEGRTHSYDTSAV
jgi:hypothetical protein